MYLTLGELRSDIYKLARSASTNVIAGTTELDRAINNAILSVSSSYPWRWRKYRVTIQTQAPYSTGTITLTGASRSVSGSGTSWTTGWTGMWLKVDGEAEWYPVKSISSTTALTLETPYQGANTGSGKSYTLYKRVYTLPSVVDDPSRRLIISVNNACIDYMSQEKFDIQFLNHTHGYIYNYTLVDTSYTTRSYTTGTVAGTQGTATLTGTTTSWLGNVLEGDELEISSTKYTVLTVDSDTQITLAQLLQTSPSGTSYTVRSVRALNLEFGNIPDDEYNIEIPCHKRLYKVIDANDIIPIPTESINVVRYQATAEILAMHDSTKSEKYEAMADKEVQRMLTDQSFGVDNDVEVER